MRIDLRTVKKEPQLFEESIQTDIPEVKGEVSAAVNVRRILGGYEVNGKAAGIFDLSCSKCLKRFERPFEVEFRLVFKTGENNETGDKAASWDDLDVAVFTGEYLDLSENIRGEILLEIPSKPLCSEDCKGICPVCGKDLNEGDCGCGDKRVAPAMSDLKKIKEQLYGGE